jgi:hypothetical protein
MALRPVPASPARIGIPAEETATTVIRAAARGNMLFTVDSAGGFRHNVSASVYGIIADALRPPQTPVEISWRRLAPSAVQTFCEPEE